MVETTLTPGFFLLQGSLPDFKARTDKGYRTAYIIPEAKRRVLCAVRGDGEGWGGVKEHMAGTRIYPCWNIGRHWYVA